MRIHLISCPGLSGSREEESGPGGHDTISCPQSATGEPNHLFPLLPGHLALYLLYDILRACSGFSGIQTFLETLEEEHVMKLSYLRP